MRPMVCLPPPNRLRSIRRAGAAIGLALLTACAAAPSRPLVVTRHQVPEPPAEQAAAQALVQAQYANIVEMACLSELAYGNKTLPAVCGQWTGGTGIAVHPHTVWLQDAFGRPYAGSYTTIVDDNRRRQIVAVRGSDDVNDWLTDFRFEPTLDRILQVAVHTGFHLYARAVLDSLLQPAQFRELNPTYDTYVTGHSLGGAAAMLVGLYLYVGYPNLLAVKGVYTYGQPKVFDNHGATSWPNFSRDIYRLENCEDPVPMLPVADDLIDSFVLDPLSGRAEREQYEHVGHEIELLNPNLPVQTGGAYWVPDRNELVRNTVGEIEAAIEAIKGGNPTGHDIALYLSRLQALPAGKTIPPPTNPNYQSRMTCGPLPAS